MENYPIYNMIVTYEDDETGILRNSFVKNPAVLIEKISFEAELEEEKQEFKFSEDESEQLFMSVSCLADTIIPRKSKSGKKYGVVFSSDVIRIAVNKMIMEGRMNEINWQHQNGNIIPGVYLVEHFTQNKKRVYTDLFGDIPEGSWVTTYFVKDKELYESLKNDPDFGGFSIEINAYLEETYSEQFEKMDDEIDALYSKIEEILSDSKLSYEEKYDKLEILGKQI